MQQFSKSSLVNDFVSLRIMCRLIVVISIFTFFSFTLHAQEFRHYHQIFTEDTIQQLKEVQYDTDSIAPVLEYKLSDDQKAIHLLNYDGKTRVKAVYVTASGELKEITRYRCNIHSLPEL